MKNMQSELQKIIHYDAITRYLKIVEYLKRRYTVDGKIVLSVGSKPSKYSILEYAAYQRYVIGMHSD